MIYNKYSGPGGQMSAKDLLNFLLNEQREEATLHNAVRLIEKYEVDETGKLHFGTGSSGGVGLIQALRPYFCRFFISSEAEKAHDQRWLPDVHAPGRGLHLQPGSQTSVPGHAPAPQPLLHLLLAQHLPDGGPAQRPQQHGGLHQVSPLITSSSPGLDFRLFWTHVSWC